MRILLAAQQSARQHAVPAYRFWAGYFRKGLEEAGHTCLEVEGVDWAEGLACTDERSLQSWRERAWTRTVQTVAATYRKGGIDLFLGYLFPKQVDASAVRLMHDLGIPCVNFFCDNVREFRTIPEAFRPFDLHWVPERQALDLYERAGMPAIWAPMPCWVGPDLRRWRHRERYGPTFVGSRDEQREALFADVLDRGIHLELRGSGWNGDPPKVISTDRLKQHVRFVRSQGATAWARRIFSRFRAPVNDTIFESFVHDRPNDGEYARVLQECTVAVGVNRYPSYRHPFGRPDAYSRLRDIEAPMLGACYLTEWCDGLEDMYDIGDEVEAYRTADELAFKVEEISRDPQRRRRMRRRAQARALSDHTVGRSVGRIADRLGVRT